MDQKSGKQPVNVHSETEEAENEMKKKTSKRLSQRADLQPVLPASLMPVRRGRG